MGFQPLGITRPTRLSKRRVDPYQLATAFYALPHSQLGWRMDKERGKPLNVSGMILDEKTVM